MLMILSCQAQPDFRPTDLGYLVHKHPGKFQTYGVAHGHVHVFYPEVTAERCQLAMLLEIDPVGLVRRRGQALDTMGGPA